MSLSVLLNDNSKRTLEFQKIFNFYKIPKSNYYTISGKIPFSSDYKTLVPNKFRNKHQISLLEKSFKHVARFRIAQFLGREDGVIILPLIANYLKKINNRSIDKINIQHYQSNQKNLYHFVKNKSVPISEVFNIAVHLAKYEEILTNIVFQSNPLNLDKFLFCKPSEYILSELSRLMEVFEKTFMIPEIVNPKSKVVFNPHFGISSVLIEGAKADIFIDGMLIDFSITDDYKLYEKDHMRLYAYYLLTAFHVGLIPKELHLFWENVTKVAFYKARFGELEVYDAKKYIDKRELRKKLKRLALFFEPNEHLLMELECWKRKNINERIKTLKDIDVTKDSETMAFVETLKNVTGISDIKELANNIDNILGETGIIEYLESLKTMRV